LKQTITGKRIRSIGNNAPYANLVGKAVVRNADEVLPFMKSEGFDPKRMMVFEPEYSSKPIFETEGETVNGSYTVLSYQNETICIKTLSDRSGYLVLSEIFYPGWQATVDGKKVPVLCGNYIFRVIPLEKGAHDVSFQFVSWPFRFGGIISLLTLIGSAWFVFKRR